MDGRSPATPNTPYGSNPNQYKTNIGRQKTRKWVEAKVQSYDGDDWGADEFDDEEEEDEEPKPQPTPKPRLTTGLRAIGQGLGSRGSSQPSTPHSARSSPGLPSQMQSQFAKPAVGAGTGASGMRSVTGPLSLHIQTQTQTQTQPQPPVWTVAAERAATEEMLSPQSAKPAPPGASSSVYPTNSSQQDGYFPTFTPPTENRSSPAPRGAGAGGIPARFPPRKSSYTQKETPDFADASNLPHRSSSRPGSAASQNKTRQEERASTASGGVKSPISPSKPVPFIRPADIYRRMEEEKKKQGESMESADRPSLDSITDRSAACGSDRDNSELPHKAAPEPTARNQGRRASFGREDGTDTNRGGLQPLATVAERKSEYGFDGLMIDPGSNSGTQPTKAPKIKLGPEPTSTQPAAPSPAHPQLSEPFNFSEPSSAEPVKRYSSSPKLPDVSRLSGFGADFFSGGLLSSVDAPPSTIQGNMAADNKSVPEPGSAGSQLLPDPPQRFFLPTEPISEAVTRQLPPHPAVESSASTPQPEQHQPKPKSFRPSLPGTWVSETTTPGEMATPGVDATSNTFGDLTIHSPISEREEDSTYLQPRALGTRFIGGDGVGDIESDTCSERSGRASPHSPAPLRITPSPTKCGSESAPPPPLSKDDQDSPANCSPDTATSFAPPAPLQPRKGEAPSEEARRPIEKVATTSTLDNSSPLKESDMLRDEIMRSLSPIGPSNERFSISGGGGASTGPLHDPFTRESAYLDDVYGDYWGGHEKKRGMESPRHTPTAGKDESSLGIQAPPPAASTPPRIPSPQAEVIADSPETVRPSPRTKRFSWEAGSEDLNALASRGPSPIKLALPASPSAEVAPPTKVSSVIPSEDDAGRSSSAASSGSGSSQSKIASSARDVSQQELHVTSLPALHGSDAIEPSSPVSNSIEDSAPRHDSESNQLSQYQSPSYRLSSASLQDEHVALPVPADLVSRSGTSTTSSDKMTVMNFKDIMVLPTTNDRVEKYIETRAQFASMDAGLSEWLAHMTEKPEHIHASASYNYPSASGDEALLRPRGLPTATDGQQLHLNASSSNMNAATPGSRPTGSMSQQHGLGDFKHTSAQVGTKGKDLLFAAGKAGKGLLSKGKNKLREKQQQRGSGGDKVFF